MSALPPKADTPSGDREVRFVPIADKMVRRGAMSALLSPKRLAAGHPNVSTLSFFTFYGEMRLVALSHLYQNTGPVTIRPRFADMKSSDPAGIGAELLLVKCGFFALVRNQTHGTQ